MVEEEAKQATEAEKQAVPKVAAAAAVNPAVEVVWAVAAAAVEQV